MRIRSLLSWTFRVALILTALLFIAMSLLIARSADENSDAATLARIRILLLERLILRSEIYNNYSVRAVNQVYERSGQLESMLAKLGTKKPDTLEATILAEFKQENASITALFSKLVAKMQDATPQEAATGFRGAYEKLLFNQILFKAYVLSDDAQRLESINRAKLDAINRGITWLYALTLLVLVLMIVLSYSMVARKLANGIEKLKKSLARIGDGDLDHVVPLDTADEIAEISSGINKMTASLKHSLVSINELEHLIADRTGELQSSNCELEAFAYSVAHDLRAPLRSIDGFAKILEEEYGQVLDTEGKRILGIIRSSDQSMDRLIRDLLEITRIGKTALSVSLVDMHAMAVTAFNQTLPPDARPGFELIVDELPTIEADPLLMERVWSNLMSNAIKYSMPSATHRIEVTYKEHEDMITYSIKDHGVGFDATYVDKLFGMFQRLHTASEFEGTGIGLAIVKRIITRHGGTVRAEGSPDAGATFHVSLPRRVL